MDTYIYQDKLRNLLAWFLDVRSKLLDSEGEHRPWELADHIACDYSNLTVSSDGTEQLIKSVPPISREYFGEDKNYRLPVKKLYELVNGELSEYITHFYLHGSLATGDYKKGWSDLDTLMIVKKAVLIDPQKLLELRRICYAAWPLFLQITPLQHHGFIVAAEFDLASYSSRLLPPAVLDTALSLKDGCSELKLLLRKNRESSFELLEHRYKISCDAVETGIFKYHPKDGIYLLSRYENADNAMYQLFSFLGNIMLAPAYFLDAIGRSSNKKQSFDIARPLFSQKSWSIVDRATQIRALWPEKEGLAYRGNSIPKWVKGILGEYYFEDSYILWEEAVTQAKHFIRNE